MIVWHDARPWIESAWRDKAEVKKRIDFALGQPFVSQDGKMLVEENDNGRSYSCMDQGDMGVVLLRAGFVLGMPEYVQRGIDCLTTIHAPYKDGGLRSGNATDGMWFHGITSRSNRFPGGTLNKHLHAVRSLLDGANVLDNAGGYDKTVALLRKNGELGIRQLVTGDKPSLLTFYAGKRSWYYYAVDYSTLEGRFLDNKEEKNGGYHLFCMKLLHQISTMIGKKAWENVSLQPMLTIYERKLAEGLYVDSQPSEGGNFDGVSASQGPLDQTVVDWFRFMS